MSDDDYRAFLREVRAYEALEARGDPNAVPDDLLPRTFEGDVHCKDCGVELWHSGHATLDLQYGGYRCQSCALAA
jgi:hypothetical protein